MCAATSSPARQSLPASQSSARHRQLNDLYDINHEDRSETLLESAADFNDTPQNRNLIDAVAKANGWAPYRTVVCYLMYHLQEDNLVLL